MGASPAFQGRCGDLAGVVLALGRGVGPMKTDQDTVLPAPELFDAFLSGGRASPRPARAHTRPLGCLRRIVHTTALPGPNRG